MTNTTIWYGVCKPPASALKQIAGGRLKGMTDINPQWRYLAMTETFGPCGFGWVYEIDRLWTEKGVDAEVMAFAQVSLRVKAQDGAWSERIVGIGGSALIAIEKSGPKASDECYKMAITDALSVAMKMLGVGADIYMGRWDGSKYKGGDDTPPPTRGASAEAITKAMGAPASAGDGGEVEELYEKAAILGGMVGKSAQQIVTDFSMFNGKFIESPDNARSYLSRKPDGKWVSMTTRKIEDAINERSAPKSEEMPDWATGDAA